MFHEIICHKFPVFPEKYRYFSGNFQKISKEISGNFLTHIPYGNTFKPFIRVLPGLSKTESLKSNELPKSINYI